MGDARTHVKLHRIPPGQRLRRRREPHTTPRPMASTRKSICPRWLPPRTTLPKHHDGQVSTSQTLVNEHNEVGGTTSPILEFLYEKTEPNSPIRRLDVAIMHMGAERIQYADFREPCSGYFCKALAIHSIHSIQYIQSHVGQNGLTPIVPWSGGHAHYYRYPEGREEDLRRKREIG